MIQDSLIMQNLKDAELRLHVLVLDFAVGLMSLETVSMYVCVSKIEKEICIVLISSYSNSRVMLENP